MLDLNLDVQSGPRILRSCDSSGVDMTDACGLIEKQHCRLHVERWSAVWLAIPGICLELNVCQNGQNYILSKCITACVSSLLQRLLLRAATTLLLSLEKHGLPGH